ncbi:MAG: (2Fe-2S)-binding protein [Bacteroidia bacterium]|nr:MAG: (2Fe-2S)-binding protein [Bacteroidia bacterium]
MEKVIKFNLNGKIVEITLDRDYTLLWALRNQFGLTGTKYGCGIGYCGSCTVLVDKIPVRSCNVPVSDVEGKNVVTIEGLSSNGKLHFLQQAFVDNDALQCGYCTPGMILTAYGLLSGNPSPTYEEIVEGMEDNLCRCGSHVRVIKAIQTASEEMKGGKKL